MKKDLRVDPRKIRRQHRWKLGQDVYDQDDHDDPNIAYLDIKYEGGSLEPDQRDMLTGGPPSGLPCQCTAHPQCQEETRIAGSMSMWEVYDQEQVELVNRQDIDRKRRKELEEERVVVLACPLCTCKTQFLESMVKQLVRHRE